MTFEATFPPKDFNPNNEKSSHSIVGKQTYADSLALKRKSMLLLDPDVTGVV